MDYITNLPILRDIDIEGFFIRMNEIDFEGQRLSDKLYKVIIRIFLVLAIIISYTTQRLSNGTITLLVGTFIAILICVPSWPYFNRNHIKFQAHKPENKFDEFKK